MLPQPVAQLPLGLIPTILEKAESPQARDWYAAAALQYGWSPNVLLNTMMNRSMEPTGTAPSNFSRELASADSELGWLASQQLGRVDFCRISRR